MPLVFTSRTKAEKQTTQLCEFPILSKFSNNNVAKQLMTVLHSLARAEYYHCLLSRKHTRTPGEPTRSTFIYELTVVVQYNLRKHSLHYRRRVVSSGTICPQMQAYR